MHAGASVVYPALSMSLTAQTDMVLISPKQNCMHSCTNMQVFLHVATPITPEVSQTKTICGAVDDSSILRDNSDLIQHSHKGLEVVPVGVSMLVLPALEDRYSLKALFLVYTPVSTNDVTAPVSSCTAIGTNNVPWVVLQVPVWSGCKWE